ncbi:MAG: Uma2 family endonuclease [Verrucomicrobia bacterium]|nr:Uma2 family endonuclease [Verrucomicrobiota bacterium]MDA1085985.1 Uma2 family endonuclease [Verrucomicrobiota bacterium]
MSADPARKRAQYTWTDYRSWPDTDRWQLINGEAYATTPAPTTRHQKLASRFTHHFENHFDGKPCDVYPAPTDVKLTDEDVVQPDIVIVWDPNQITETHIEGPPTLVVEILSPSTELLDRGRKLDLYARSGVQEVWLVRPYPSLLEIFVLKDSAYLRAHAFTRDQPFESPTFPDLELDLETLFEFPIPPEERIDVVKEGRPPYVATA